MILRMKKIVRQNNVANKIEQLTEFLHVKQIDSKHKILEFFIPQKFGLEKISDDHKIFKEIIDEMPIMEAHIWNDEFSIKYNRWVYIKLIDTKVQIYRDSKIRKLGLV
jgi:hypothetical protein